MILEILNLGLILKKNSTKSINGKWVSTRPGNPTIRIRYPVNRTFNIQRPVFIGNRAKHAAYALEGGKVQNFIQGRLAKIIRDTMKEKKTKVEYSYKQDKALVLVVSVNQHHLRSLTYEFKKLPVLHWNKRLLMLL